MWIQPIGWKWGFEQTGGDMKAVVVMFDSLNRHLLSPYGCEWTHTPNFKRLAERTGMEACDAPPEQYERLGLR